MHDAQLQGETQKILILRLAPSENESTVYANSVSPAGVENEIFIRVSSVTTFTLRRPLGRDEIFAYMNCV